MDGVQSSALIALASAAAWGGGDFSGGLGVKAAGGSLSSAIRFVMLAHAMSLCVLLCLLWAMHGGLVWSAPVGWAMLGGVTGALGLVAFYMALSRGAMGASAAVSGLLAAAIPAGVSSVMEGAPSVLRLGGFALAGAAIWMIAAGSPEESSHEARSTTALAILGGVAFGVYFVALKMANPLGVVMPMAIARTSSLVVCLPVVVAMGLGGAKAQIPFGNDKQKSGSHKLTSWLMGWRWAMGVALLDTGGNMLFVAATRLGRLDVASVLASLYPASTILLAAWYLHERPTRRQVAGMVTALAAVVMVTV